MQFTVEEGSNAATAEAAAPPAGQPAPEAVAAMNVDAPRIAADGNGGNGEAAAAHQDVRSVFSLGGSGDCGCDIL